MQPPIFTKTMNLSGLFLVPSFIPAPVQRGVEWDLFEVKELLRELEQAFFVAEPDLAADLSTHDKEGNEDDDEASTHLDNLDDQLAGSETAPLNEIFLGTMVFHTSQERPDKLTIYDGLQRTVTLTIFFSVLRDLSNTAFKKVMANMVTNEEGKHRLQLNGNDQTLIIDVQNEGAIFRVDKISARRDVGKRIQRIKQFLKKKFEQWDEAKRERFGLFLTRNVWVNIVRTHDARLARQIFISTNLYGKRLQQISILKGQIGDLARNDEDATKILGFWDQMSEKFGDDFEPILKAVDMIYRTEPQGKQWPIDLGAHLKAHIKEGAILSWLERVESYGMSWRRIKYILATGGQKTPIEQSIFRLKFLPWDDWMTAVLFYWNRVEYFTKEGSFSCDSDLYKDYTRFFDAFHRRCIGLVLVYGANDLPPVIFQKVILQAKKGQFATKWARRGFDESNGALVLSPNNRIKIDRTLQSQIKEYKIWVSLMKWLEMIEWRDNLPELMVKTQVEHIIPRNPQTGIVPDANYDKLCYSLGNLAVLDAQTNGKIENCQFSDKKPFLETAAQNYHLLKSVIIHDQWQEPEIMLRAEQLRNQVWAELRFKKPKAQ